MKASTITIKSEYTPEELKKFYLLECQEPCSWKGLSRDVIDIVESDDDSINYVCPHCGKNLNIVR